jgi:hypothetical protein
MFIGFGVSMRVGLRGWWGGVGWGCGLRVEEGGVRSGGVEEWRRWNGMDGGDGGDVERGRGRGGCWEMGGKGEGG